MMITPFVVLRAKPLLFNYAVLPYIECGEQLRLLFGLITAVVKRLFRQTVICCRPASRSADRRSSRGWHP